MTQTEPTDRNGPEVKGVARAWMSIGLRLLPFADAATAELPLGRLLRLSLFQVSVGMAVVLLIGTLNRVMIVELGVPVWLVATMISLPLIFAPFRALVGFKSDTHRSALGWKRVPYLWFGTLLQFGGLAIMPFALILLSGDSNAPAWFGQGAAALAFLMMGAGLHTVQTAGLALATDLAPQRAHPKVVALLCVMMMLGMMVSALVFGALLAHFSELRLIKVVQGAAALTMVINIVALWKQEPRDPARTAKTVPQPTFAESWKLFAAQGRPARRLIAVALGTMAFSMQDVLLEPYGGQILHLSVGATTGLTAILAVGGLVGFVVAARKLGKGTDPYRFAALGTVVGVGAFTAIIFAAPLDSRALFAVGVCLIGLGSGIFAHCTLTAAMGLAQAGQTGLVLGIWGAVQASAAGLAVAAGGLIRDLVSGLAVKGTLGPGMEVASVGYSFVYHCEIALLFATLVALGPLVRRATGPAPRTFELTDLKVRAS
jgi:BCD family chlorophyll transporter-like MFS transporter